MWELEDYLSVKTAAAGDRYKSAKTFWAYNCREETKALTSFIMYSGSMGEGEAVFTFTVQERNWEWTPVAPGTSGETTWKIACGKE